MMKTKLFSILLHMALVSGALSETAVPAEMFDCGRQGTSCENGSCNKHACDCDTGFTSLLDYHCVEDSVASKQCTDSTKCQNGGECRKVDGVDTCFCPQLYTGSSCETRRLGLSCEGNAMTVTVRPYGDFTGAIFVHSYINNPKCRFVKSGRDWSQTFSFDTSADNHCGMTQSPADDGIEFSLVFVVQYISEPNILTYVDQEIKAICLLKNTVVVSTVQEVKPAKDDTGPLTLVLLASDGISLIPQGATLKVGTAFTVAIIMVEEQASQYIDFLVSECSVSNGKNEDSAEYASFNVVENGGCPSNASIVRGGHERDKTDKGPRVKMPLRAFMFAKGQINGKNTLRIACSVILCNANANSAGACNPPDAGECGKNNAKFTQGKGRRRRAVNEEQTEEMGQTIYVATGDPTGSDTATEQTGTAGDCLKENPESQTIVAALALTNAAALGSVGVMAAKYRKKKQKEKEQQQM